MANEHHQGGEQPRQEAMPEEYSFDELARGLASGTLSRGRALKLVGAALLGSALGIFGLAAPAEAQRRRRRCAPCTTDDPGTYPAGYCCLTPTGGTSGCLVPESFCASPPSGTECTCAPAEPCSATNPCGGGLCCSNGQCVFPCPSGQCCSAFEGGQCLASCPPGQCCSSFGVCGLACPAGSAVACCPPGFGQCCPEGSDALCCAEEGQVCCPAGSAVQCAETLAGCA